MCQQNGRSWSHIIITILSLSTKIVSLYNSETWHNYKNDIRINQIISACIKYIFILIQMLQSFETLHLIYLENNNCMNYQELFNVRKYITLKSIYRVRQNLSSFNGLNWKTIPIFFRTTLPWGTNYLTKQYLKKKLVLLQIVFSLHRYFWKYLSRIREQ